MPERKSVDTEGRPCPACGDHRPSRVLGVQGGFPWRVCRVCSCHFAARSATPEERQALYESDTGAGNPTVPVFVRRRLEEIVGGFERYRREGRLLDVGSGAGTLLEAAEGLGWNCWGLELSLAAAERGRQRGWEVRHGDFLTAAFPSGSFDVVCMVGVLEHVEAPLAHLRRALELLRPGGLLYVATPNAMGLNGRALGVRWSVFAAPEHMQLFTSAALRAVLRTAGFRTRRVLVEGLSIAEIRAKRKRKKGETIRVAGAPVDRVPAGDPLNEQFSPGAGRRMVKHSLNRLLTATRLGDALRAYAERPAS